MASLFRRIGVSNALLLFVFPLCFLQMAHAQTTATVEGLVVDIQGAAIPNATVVVTNTDTAIAHTVKTDAAGRYQVIELIAGPYKIEAEATGFKKTELTGITLNVAQVQREDATLHVGGANETVDVQTQAITTETETS